MSPVCGESVSRGSPRARDLLRDALAGARAQRLVTVTTVLVLAVVGFVVVVTTGQSAVAEQQVLSRVDSVGTRMVVVSDDGGQAGVLPEAVEQVERVSGVSWAFGLGPVTDVQNAALRSDSTGVPLRPLVGDLPPGVDVVAGRVPRPGEAVVEQDAARSLGLADGVGVVAPTSLLQAGVPPQHDARLIPVVGVIRVADDLSVLDGLVLQMTAPSEAGELRFVHVMARDYEVVRRLGDVLRRVVPAREPDLLTVETPEGALALRRVIAGDLGAGSRRLMVVVLGVGVAIVAVTMFGAVAGRRREFGRRRALGATRSAIVAVVMVQAGCAAVVGAGLGVGLGLLSLARTVGGLPSVGFVAGVGVLTVVVALLGSVPPALAAAWRDPLRILRVP